MGDLIMTNLAHKAFRFSTFASVSFETFLDRALAKLQPDCLMTAVCRCRSEATVQKLPFRSSGSAPIHQPGIRCSPRVRRSSKPLQTAKALRMLRMLIFGPVDIVDTVCSWCSLAHRSLPAVLLTKVWFRSVCLDCAAKTPAWTRWNAALQVYS